MSSGRVERLPLTAARAAPLATKRWAFSGQSMCSSSSSSVTRKRLRSSERYWRGPPRKATCPRIGLPHARPEMVCVTTDWKIDAATSAGLAPSLSSGCTSVLAKTPQRLAMG